MDNLTKIRSALAVTAGAELSSWATFLGFELEWRQAQVEDITEGRHIRLMTQEEMGRYDAGGHADWRGSSWDGTSLYGIEGYAVGVVRRTNPRIPDGYAWFNLAADPTGRVKYRGGSWGFHHTCVMVRDGL